MRSLVGTILMILFVILYAVIVALVSHPILQSASNALHPWLFRVVQVLYYALAGLAWVFPLLPLIKWMNKPDAGKIS